MLGSDERGFQDMNERVLVPLAPREEIVSLSL